MFRTRKHTVRRRPNHRRFIAEALEDRVLLTTTLEIYPCTLDVNNDGSVGPIDALMVINDQNEIARGGQGSSNPRIDVNRDGNKSPLDALWVINYINANGAGRLPESCFVTSTITVEADDAPSLPRQQLLGTGGNETFRFRLISNDTDTIVRSLQLSNNAGFISSLISATVFAGVEEIGHATTSACDLNAIPQNQTSVCLTAAPDDPDGLFTIAAGDTVEVSVGANWRFDWSGGVPKERLQFYVDADTPSIVATTTTGEPVDVVMTGDIVDPYVDETVGIKFDPAFGIQNTQDFLDVPEVDQRLTIAEFAMVTLDHDNFGPVAPPGQSLEWDVAHLNGWVQTIELNDKIALDTWSFRLSRNGNVTCDVFTDTGQLVLEPTVTDGTFQVVCNIEGSDVDNIIPRASTHSFTIDAAFASLEDGFELSSRLEDYHASDAFSEFGPLGSHIRWSGWDRSGESEYLGIDLFGNNPIQFARYRDSVDAAFAEF